MPKKDEEISALERLTKKERTALDEMHIPNYMRFLEKAKTPERVVAEVKDKLEGWDVVRYEEGMSKDDAKHGFYMLDRDERQFALVLFGKKPATEGISILTAHTDTPCLTLRSRPIREGPEGILLAAKPYGYLWPHQWLDSQVDVIGTFFDAGKRYSAWFNGMLSDRGAHVSKEELADMELDEAFEHEMLSVVTGHPTKEKLLEEMAVVGLDEESFFTGTWYVVPSGKGRILGDRLMASYGHDDRLCVYASVHAALDARRTFPVIVYGTAREEVGSTGIDGSCAPFIESAIDALLMADGEDQISSALQRKVMMNSRMLSCDVDIAFTSYDSDYQDEEVASRFDKGISLVKSDSDEYQFEGNLASDEMTSYVVALFKKAGVVYQMAELPSKLQCGGGGTVAKFFAHRGIHVIDAGPPVGNMHGKNPLAHIGDFGQTLKAYSAFVRRKR